MNNARKLTPQEVYDNIDDYSVLSLGNATQGIPKDTQFIAKIVEPIEKQFVEALDNTVYKVPVKYDEGLEEPLYFKVKVSEGAVKRVEERHGEDYVGKRAFFTKSSWKGRLVHHVNVILNEGNGPKEKPPLKLKETKDEQPADGDLSDIAEPVKEVYKGEEKNTVVDHKLPKEKQPELQPEIEDWAKKFESMKDDFVASFCQDGNYPKTFVDWVKDEKSCGTDYFTQFSEDDVREEGAKAYFAICHRLGI